MGINVVDLLSHSFRVQTLYADLLRTHLDDAASELRGSVVRKERNGRVYLYDSYRLGTQVVSRYVGEETEALQARLARAKALRGEAAERRRAQARLVRALRAEGVSGFDAAMGGLLAAFARIGVFRLGGTVVGTAAFRIYELELGVRPALGSLAQTGDVDVASFTRLSLALGDEVTEPVGRVLAELRLGPVPSLDGHRVWKWQDAARESLVEFLTPAFGAEGLRDLPALGVSAQGLHYLNFLLREPIRAVALYRSGVLVQVPDPCRYAVHKLIVADRRGAGPDALKAQKDRMQAAFLVEALARDRPDELGLAWEEARGEGPRWRERLDRSLGRMPETAERLRALG